MQRCGVKAGRKFLNALGLYESIIRSLIYFKKNKFDVLYDICSL